MQIIIRDANIDDMQSVLEIVNYEILNSTSIYDYNPHTLAQRIEWYENQITQNMPVIVAELNGDVIGYGSFGAFRYKEGYKYCVEHSVYVHSQKRNFGAGKLLMQQLITIAKSMSIHTMIAGIDAENQESIDFHKKFGFTEAGRIKEAGYKFNKWLDVVFMQLMLAENNFKI